MEDLSFKPITGGLGFHKSKLKIDEDALRDIQWKKEVELPEIDFDDTSSDKSSVNANRSQEKDLWASEEPASTRPSYRKPNIDLLAEDFNIDKIKQELEQKAMLSKTLPRSDIQAKQQPARQESRSENTSLEESKRLVRGLEEIRNLEKRVEESKVNQQLETQKDPLQHPSAGNWFAALIDLVVVFGMVNLFMSSLLFVTKLDVFQIVVNTYQDPMTQLSLASIFLGSCFLYMVISRSFFGATLGDWAVDIELGSKKQQQSVYYPIRVSIRFFVNLLTGFVLLPFLSVIFRTDLAGKISALGLYKTQD